MNPKERMFHAIERTIRDIAAMQDVVIRLTREIHEVHVAKEHDQKLALMKEQIQELKVKMDAMQEFLYACERPAGFSDRKVSEIDFS